MAEINRIGAPGRVSRDSPSSGVEAVAAKNNKLENADGVSPAHADVKTAPRNKKVDEVAKLYEKQFLGEMVKAMRSTVSFSDTSKPSMAENIYRDQLDGEYVESWGENGGIGMSNLIYDQLMGRYFNHEPQSLKKQGPIKLSDRDVSTVSRVQAEPGGRSGQIPLKVNLVPGDNKDGPAKLTAPWDGEVLSNQRLGDKTALTLQHDDGVRSTLIFKGVASHEMQVGRAIAKNQTIGVLSPEINSFFWNLNRSAENRPKSGPAGIE
jgi:flagellar protein FlgJ